MTEPADVVRRFLTLLENGDAEAAVALLAPEVVWRNTGLPTVRGRRVGGMLRDMQKRRIGFRVELHHIAGSDGVVLTDRTDYLTYKRWESAFWVCGTFEVRDGLITVWDDHFSMGTFVAASLRGLVSALRP